MPEKLTRNGERGTLKGNAERETRNAERLEGVEDGAGVSKPVGLFRVPSSAFRVRFPT
jgi:hypothetical protein